MSEPDFEIVKVTHLMPSKDGNNARTKKYIDDMCDELGKVKGWHTKMVAFFASRKAPHIDRLLETKKQLENGQAATREAMLFVNRLQEAYKFLHTSSINVTVFKEKIDKQANKLPTVPHEAGGDESVLTLAALSHYWYDQAEHHQLVLKRLETVQNELKTLVKRYTGDGAKKIDALDALNKQYQTNVDKAAKQLDTYTEAAGFYSQNKTSLDVLATTKSRRDVWEERSKYVNMVLSLWRKHDEFCKEAQTTTTALLEAERKRIEELHRLLLSVGEGLVASTTTGQDQMNTCMQRMKQTPSQAETYRRQEGDKHNPLFVETTLSRSPSTTASTKGEKPKEADNVPAPGPFPRDTAALLHTPVTRKGFFSTKTFTMVYTKTHFIYLLPLSVYSGNDVVKTNPHMDAESKDYVNSYDLDKVRWKIDGYKTLASREGVTVTLFERNDGFFSRNQTHVVVCEDDKTAEEWVQLINSHSNYSVPEQPQDEPLAEEKPAPAEEPPQTVTDHHDELPVVEDEP